MLSKIKPFSILSNFKKKKVIFFFNDLSLTGAPIIFNNYLEESLLSDLFKVSVYSRYGGELNIKSSDCLVIRKKLRKSNFGKLISKISDLINVLKIFIKTKPDLIVTNTYINSIPIFAGKILKHKTVCVIHENMGAKIKYLSIRRLIINSADIIITVSQASSQFCIMNGASLKKIKKITNGINLNKLAIKNLQNNKPTYTLGALANWSEYKRLDVVLSVFEYLQDISNSKFKLIIGGDSFYEYSNEFAYLKEKFESECICFVGKVKNNELFYSQIDGFLFFSEHESFPTVLLETLFYQIPTFTLMGIDSAEEVADNALIQAKSEKDLASDINKFFNEKYLENYFIWQKKCLTTLKKHDIKSKWSKIETALNSTIKQ